MAEALKKGLLSGLGSVLRFLGNMIAVLFMLAFGVLFFGAGLYGFDRISTGYEPVEATVHETRPAVKQGSPNTSSRNTYSVTAAIEYRYEVDGESHRGRDVLDFGRVGSPSKAERLAAGATELFASGASIEAFVDPADPGRSVLERKGAVYAIPALAFGTLVLATVVGMTFFSVRDWWRHRRGVDVDTVQESKAAERWMGVGAGIFLAFVIITAIVVDIGREPIFWTVLLPALAVAVVMILRDRRGREAS